MPTSVGYSSMYAGDMHVMPSATSTQPHYVTTPRGYTTSTTSSGVPTTTRTYAVTPDNRQRQSTRDSGHTRRSTLDSTSRPPVIITTTQTDRPHASSSHSSNTRSGSPIRDEYRSSDGQFYAQPASSIRSRSSARPYHVASGSEDYGRSRDRSDSLLSPREVDAYRSSRPSVVYPSDPKHSTAAVDYGDDGYQYTNAGELARYDLDQSKPSRPRRHDSVDRGYYRPNVNYSADQRSFNVNTSHDLSRNYNMNTSRPYEGGRGGPPPSTRGFDKINQGYGAPRDVPPAAPVPPSPTTSSQLELPGPSERREAGRRSRPLSLHQDGAPRSSHHDDYYRSREDERNLRDLRERERDAERPYEPPRFKDESVATRGFGIRTDLLDASGDRRRESRLEEPKKRSDEELARGSDVEREERRRSRQAVPEERRDRRESRREDDEDDKERSRIRDKVAASLGVAATAVGLVPSVKGDKQDSDAGEPKRRRSPDEDRERRKELELADRPVVVEKEREPERQRERVGDDSREAVKATERHRRDAEAKLAGEAVVSSSDSDDTRRTSRRHRPSNAFNPNDASDLNKIKEQLAAMEVSDRSKERERESLAIEGKPRSRSPSPAKEPTSGDSSRDQSRGRELVVPGADGKQVRVVSPPKDKSDEKPLKGILKQPRVRFPEEANPIREGVAPHKEDKKLKEAPAGARWTKINRKIVNPEALTVGKERFEVRDDFVIVLRVLSKEEIQAYAAATQVLRGTLNAVLFFL